MEQSHGLSSKFVTILGNGYRFAEIKIPSETCRVWECPQLTQYRSKRSKNGKLQTFRVGVDTLPELPKTETGYPRFIYRDVWNEKTRENERRAYLVYSDDDVGRIFGLKHEKSIAETGVGDGARSRQALMMSGTDENDEPTGFETPLLATKALEEAYQRLSELQTPEHVAAWLSEQLGEPFTAESLIKRLTVPQSQLDEWKVNRDSYAEEVADTRGSLTDEEMEVAREKDRIRKLKVKLDEKLASGEVSEADYPKYLSGELKLPHGGSRAGAGRKPKQPEKLPSEEFFEDQSSDSAGVVRMLEQFATCEFCGKTIFRGNYRGPLPDQLKRHQETRDCLKARLVMLGEMEVFSEV